MSNNWLKSTTEQNAPAPVALFVCAIGTQVISLAEGWDANTVNRIACYAINLLIKYTSDIRNTEKYSEFSVNDSFYEFKYASRRFYDRVIAKRLVIQVLNNQGWRVAV